MVQKSESNNIVKPILITVLAGLLLYLLSGWVGKVNETCVRANTNETKICSIKDDVSEIKDDVKWLARKMGRQERKSDKGKQ